MKSTAFINLGDAVVANGILTGTASGFLVDVALIPAGYRAYHKKFMLGTCDKKLALPSAHVLNTCGRSEVRKWSSMIHAM